MNVILLKLIALYQTRTQQPVSFLLLKSLVSRQLAVYLKNMNFFLFSFPRSENSYPWIFEHGYSWFIRDVIGQESQKRVCKKKRKSWSGKSGKVRENGFKVSKNSYMEKKWFCYGNKIWGVADFKPSGAGRDSRDIT